MFSKRTQWELGENPLSLELDRLKASGVSLLDLTQSNPTQAGIVYPADRILKSLADPKALVYAPHSKGILSAREAVAQYYQAKGIFVSPENIILTSSSSEAYGFLFRLLLNPREKILLPAPSYPLFSYLAGLNDVDTEFYPLYFDGRRWCVDIDVLNDLMDDSVRAVVLVSPNNPTGSCVNADEIVRLNKLCADRGVALIGDEVFIDYIFDPAHTKYESLASNQGVLSFALGGLSKAMAMPQMKLGWIIVNGPDEQVKMAIERLEVIADTYLSVNTPVQVAVVTWLKERRGISDQILARVKANAQYLKTAAIDAGVVFFPIEGGWYGVLQLSLDAPEDVWAINLLREKHVLAHPGFFFDFAEEGFLVLSLLPPEDVFAEGVRRIMAFIEK